MKKSLFICLAALMVLAVSCKKENSNDEPKQKYGVDGVTPMPEAVDLGLSVKWASFNIGASKEYEYGDYYAWGETTTKDNYDWASYKWCTGYNKLTKYCPKDQADKWDAEAKPDGPDGDVQLFPSDDVAHVKLGGKWRMPTNEDFEKLLALETEAAKDNSDYTWEKWAYATDADGNEVKDANGNIVRGICIKRKSTGATLFLPATGYRDDTNLYRAGSYGYYCSSSLDSNGPNGTWGVTFNSDDVTRGSYYRYYGLSVRPVCVE